MNENDNINSAVTLTRISQEKENIKLKEEELQNQQLQEQRQFENTKERNNWKRSFVTWILSSIAIIMSIISLIISIFK